MSGGRAVTPTPPQSAMSVPEGGAGPHANGENAPPAAMAPKTDSKGKTPPPRPMPLPQEVPIPPGEDLLPDSPPTPPPTSPISDTVDAPPPSALLAKKKPPEHPPSSSATPAAGPSPAVTKEAVGVATASSQQQPLESPIVQPEELQFNGLTAGGAMHVSPLAEPDTQREAPMPSADAPTHAPTHTPTHTPTHAPTHTPAAKDTPTTTPKDAPALRAKETPAAAAAAVAVETPAALVKDTPARVVKETSPPVVKETPSPPIVMEVSVPFVKETPSAVAKESSEPVVKETPAAVVKETPSAVVKETSAAVVKETPAAVVKETPAAVVKCEPVAMVPAADPKMDASPVVMEKATKADPGPIPEPVVQATVAEADPRPVVKDTPQTAATKAQPDDVTATATPLTTAPPQAPAPESTMQAAISVPKKKRKMKDLNKKEAVGDLLDAFKETVPTPPEPEKTAPVAPPPKEATPTAPPTEEVDETWEEKEDKLDAANSQSQRPSPATAPENSQSQRPSLATPPENSQPQRSSPATPPEKSQPLSSAPAAPLENNQSKPPSPPTPTEQKYQYKEEEWKPLDLEAKKRYDREFLLGFQFSSASLHKPQGLPPISDVVLDKANKTPLRPPDASRLPGMSSGPDFTPSYANLGRQPSGGRGPPPAGLAGPRRSGQGSRKEPRKIITSMSLGDDVQLNRAEKAWKPGAKRRPGGAEEEGGGGGSDAQTEELFRRVRSVLNKLTPQMFQPLMKQITEMTIDTEPRLKGVIDLVFEKAISEPNFSVAYANMCRCLMGLKVPMADKPNMTVNFRKLLLNRCQKEFEKDQDDDEIFERKQKELEAATEEVQQRLKEELEEAKDQARRRSLGNIKFIGELFKLKMLTEPIMHDCVVKLLKHHDEESLECLCRLLSTIGKDLDFEKAKPRMDQYFHQMEKIIKEKKTSSRIRFMLQDVLDLRRSGWVPRRGDQGPKTIEQIHKDAELEEAREQVKVQQQLLFKKEGRGGGPGGPRGGPHGHAAGGGRSANQAPDEGWNTVPISTKNRSIDPTRLTKITKPGALDLNTTLLAPGGKGMWGSWGKGSSGGTGTKPSDAAQDSARTSTVNRFSALQQPSSSAPEPDRRAPQRNSSSRERGERFDRFDRREERGVDRNRDDRPREERNRDDRPRGPMSKRSYSRERDQRPDAMRRVASGNNQSDRGSRERGGSKESVKRETAPTPPPAPTKPALSEEEMEKKSSAIIEEYLHINDLKEALQCVCELQCASLLGVFVRVGIEATLERSSGARQHLGTLLQQLIKAGTLNTHQYYKGLNEILEVAEDMAIDIPRFWLYLAEIIAPMLQEGGIPMGPLFREVAKPLQPMEKAGVMLAEILTVLSKGMSHRKIASMWLEAGLNWRDFLPEDEDVNKFVTEKAVEYTVGGEEVSVRGAELRRPQQLREELERLLLDKPDNQRIYDWVEANLDEKQVVSSAFVRALMIAICQAAVICEKPYKVDVEQVKQRAVLLQRYLKNEEKELQALYALQSLMVQLEQPPNLLRMFFDVLYDEDVIREEAFYRWESSKDPAEQVGKGVALKSVTAFFTWLREAEDESDNS